MSRRTPAHRAQKPRLSLLSLGLSALALLTAIVFSVSAAGGTYAYLSSSQSVVLVAGTGATTATITAGTATLSVPSEAITLANLYPGDSRLTTITVGNTGATALALGVDSIVGPTTANGLTSALAPGACPGTAAGVTAGPLGLTIPAGASAPVCLAVGMAASAPSGAQGLGSTVTVSLTGTQP